MAGFIISSLIFVASLWLLWKATIKEQLALFCIAELAGVISGAIAIALYSELFL